MESKITNDDFLQIAKIIAENSNGKIRIAFNEQDESTEKDEGAAHFLKLNEKRLGRDMELYGFRAKVSPESAPADFLELVFALKEECPQSYQKASIALKELGVKVYTGDVLDEWNKLFD